MQPTQPDWIDLVAGDVDSTCPTLPTIHVKIFSDEIHGDLTFNQTGYTPMFSLPAELIQNLVAAVSPSKTFNVAAMHAATVLVPNKICAPKLTVD